MDKKTEMNQAITTIRGEVEAFARRLDTHRKLRDENRRNYTPDAFARWQTEALAVLREDAAKTAGKIRETGHTLEEAVKEANSLNGGQLPPDAELFKFPGLILTEAELKELAERHAGNPTMCRLIESYAERNKMAAPVAASPKKKMEAARAIVEQAESAVNCDPNGIINSAAQLAEHWDGFTRYHRELLGLEVPKKEPKAQGMGQQYTNRANYFTT